MGADERETASQAASSTPLPRMPERIGVYRILERIGQGGMGVVYLAEQTEPVRRRVALKVIRPGMDSGEFLARFEAERQALAMMDHSGVARVYEAGVTEDGRPWLAMEHVPGVAINEYCDRRRLGIDERLGLFMRVCDAIQHAHQQGIIHRDIKPTNVLVQEENGRPITKVIDFGVAKAIGGGLTERALHTEAGRLLGTPEYMSPEQAEMTGAGVDTRTDIYSLGVLLYELLSGALPFDVDRLRSGGYGEIQRIIREEDPPRASARLSSLDADRRETVAETRGMDPRTLERRLRGDLDWIIMKAMEKDRARRYASASELCADVQRRLGGLPVLAGPPSALYRARRHMRRNRAVVIGGLAVFAALALGLVGAAWQAGRAESARRTAEEHRQRAEVALADAQRRLEQGVGLSSAFLTKIDSALRPLAGALEVREQTVREARAWLERLSEGEQDDPKVRAALADGWEAVSDVLGGSRSGNLGDYRGALESLRRAAQLRQSLAEEPKLGESEALKLARTHIKIGLAQRRTGASTVEIIESFEKGKRIAARASGSNSDAAERMTSTALLELCRYQPRIGKWSEALENCRMLTALRRRHASESPRDPDVQRRLSVALVTLGELEFAAHEFENSLGSFREALEISESLLRVEPASATARRDVALSHVYVSLPLDATGRPEEALRHAREAGKMMAALAEASPSDERVAWDRAWADQAIADAMRRTDAEEAMRLYRASLDAALIAASAAPENAIAQRAAWHCRDQIGELLLRRGDAAEAHRQHRAALDVALAMLEADPENTLALAESARTRRRLGVAAAALAEASGPADRSTLLDEARTCFEEALATLEGMHAGALLPPAAPDERPALHDALRTIVASTAAGAAPR